MSAQRKNYKTKIPVLVKINPTTVKPVEAEAAAVDTVVADNPFAQKSNFSEQGNNVVRQGKTKRSATTHNLFYFQKHLIKRFLRLSNSRDIETFIMQNVRGTGQFPQEIKRR